MNTVEVFPYVTIKHDVAIPTSLFTYISLSYFLILLFNLHEMCATILLYRACSLRMTSDDDIANDDESIPNCVSGDDDCFVFMIYI